MPLRSVRAVPAFDFCAVIIAGLEDRRGECSPNLQNARSGVREAMSATRGNDDGLVRHDSPDLVLDADLGLSLDNLKNFLDLVGVHGRAQARLAKLLEDAELSRSYDRRDPHRRQYALSPLLKFGLGIDHMHAPFNLYRLKDVSKAAKPWGLRPVSPEAALSFASPAARVSGDFEFLTKRKFSVICPD